MGETKNLSREQGIEKLRELAMDTKFCHFVTALGKKPLQSRPMTTQEVDELGNFWFLSGDSSHKNNEIENDPEVQLFFSKPDSSEFLSVFGYAEVVRDRQKLDELWSPVAKAWFSEGKDDPNLTILKVNVADAYYWDTKSNRMIQLIKLAAGAVMGRPFDDGVEGHISR